jgi:predicted extracellular nuclease
MHKNFYIFFLIFFFSLDIFSQAEINVVFPDDFQTEADYQRLTGKILNFNQTMVVTNNTYWQRYGELVLSSLRLPIPTDAALPNSSEYNDRIAQNGKNQIILDDGSQMQYPNPLPFADADGTRRTGSRVNNLKATLHKAGGYWRLYPAGALPVFYGNERPFAPTSVDGNVKVCGFNLEYYLASNYGQGYGADNAEQASRQHSKILKAVTAIDADIYGFVEIQTGQAAIQKLCRAMNLQAGDSVYACINDGTNTNGTFTKAGYIYNRHKIAPVNSLQSNNTGVFSRKKAQGFKLLSNGEKFIFLINHFKAKSGNGSGDNADKGDGQGSYNGDRKREAESVISSINSSYKAFYDDNDILIMGDLNAYRQEEPLQLFYENGYTNLLTHFEGDNAYSYVYGGQVGCLDHALANFSMAQQVVSASVFHINADEPSMFEYSKSTWQNNMYRCSDHDAVVVALNLGIYSDYVDSILNPKENELKIISDENFVTILNAEKNWLTITDVSGKQVLHKFIKEDEVQIPKNQLGIDNGVYIFFFDNMKTKIKHKKAVL